MTGSTRIKATVAAVLFCLPGIEVALAADPAEGQKLYKVQCVICHDRNGQGMTPDMPDFRRGEGLFSSDRQLVKQIENGKNACPPFMGVIEQQKILDIISYLRTLH
jgi:cytochrome c6